MRFYEVVEKVVPVKESRGAICNRCGNAFEPNDSDLLQQFNLQFGCGSKYDNQKPWGFDLCESCIANIIKEFKIVPENFMSEKSIISACDTDHDLHQRVFEEWKETGEWNWEDEDPYKDYYCEEYSEDDFQMGSELNPDEFIEKYYTDKTLKRIK